MLTDGEKNQIIKTDLFLVTHTLYTPIQEQAPGLTNKLHIRMPNRERGLQKTALPVTGQSHSDMQSRHTL